MKFQTWADLAEQINRMSPAEQNQPACAGQHPEELFPIYGLNPITENTHLIHRVEGTQKIFRRPAGSSYLSTIRTCRVCHCTELDCSVCWHKTGLPCHWVADDLCSACVPANPVTLTLSAAAK
jgi:hypothetical protein